MNEFESKPWYTSRAMIAGYAVIGLYVVAFLYQLLAGGRDLFGAAEDAGKLVAMAAPVLGGLAVIGLRGAVKPVAAILVLVLVGVGCQSPGTGSRVDPQTGTSTVGAQTFSGRTQAGATYVIKSEGTVYNIDTDGTPSSKEAVKAIASAILAYDKSIEVVNAMILDPVTTAETKADALATLKWITEEKRLYMAEAKGAFGVNITIRNTGNPGAGSSTVDTAGATGETGVPPTTDPRPAPEDLIPKGEENTKARIEELERGLAEDRAKLARLREALDSYSPPVTAR